MTDLILFRLRSQVPAELRASLVLRLLPLRTPNYLHRAQRGEPGNEASFLSLHTAGDGKLGGGLGRCISVPTTTQTVRDDITTIAADCNDNDVINIHVCPLAPPHTPHPRNPLTPLHHTPQLQHTSTYILLAPTPPLFHAPYPSHFPRAQLINHTSLSLTSCIEHPVILF